MRRAFKYRLYPTPAQAVELSQQLETLRRVYNDALSERKDCWELYGEGTKLGDQEKRWASRRNAQVAATSGPRFLARVAAVPVRDTLKRLDRAFQDFFRRCKAGEKPGYPRFRGRDRFDSIPFDNYNGGCSLRGPAGELVAGDMAEDTPLKGYRLRVFGVGAVRVKLHRPIRGKVKAVTVKREADRWFVVFSCDLGGVEIPPSTNPAVGIDVGLEHFLTTSNGEHVPNPRFLKLELPELRRRQRAASRKYRPGKRATDQSKRWKKAKARVRRLHVRVKNLRKEHAYKTAHDLTGKYGTICVEGLNVQGMLKNGKLSRSIADAGWAGFVGVLKHKAASAGARVVEVDPKRTSQLCSGCGIVVAKELRVRRHDCPHCGLSLHRDINAARNILARGVPSEQPARIGPAGRNGGSGRRVPVSSPVTCPALSRESSIPEAPKPVRKRSRSSNPAQMVLWPDDATPAPRSRGG